MIVAALLHAPACGYALKKTDGLTHGNRVLHPNVVYRLLKKFEENGWIAQRSIASERGQTRKQYRITASRKRSLTEDLSNFPERDAGDRKAFLFRVANSAALAKPKRQQTLNVHKQFLNEHATQLEKFPSTLSPNHFGASPLIELKISCVTNCDGLTGMKLTRG